jgi:sortase A
MRALHAGMIRVVGLCLCAAGAVLLGYAGVRYADGALRADEARRQWEAEQAAALVAGARSRARLDLIGSVAKPAVGAPVARLTIPRIHLDEIVLEGVGDDELNAGPGHLPGSAVPGRTGNAVISAHRDRHFRHLDELQVGDTVLTEAGLSREAWVIVSRKVIGRDTPALFQTTQPTLTLTTCWPVRYFGSAPDRLILTAHPVAESSVAAKRT